LAVELAVEHLAFADGLHALAVGGHWQGFWPNVDVAKPLVFLTLPSRARSLDRHLESVNDEDIALTGSPSVSDMPRRPGS